MKRIAITLLFLAAGLSLQAETTNAPAPQPPPSQSIDARCSLASVYQAFMERFADENPAWKKEIILHADINTPPKPPFHIGYHDSLGYYTYRVKQWDDLSDCEKFAVQNDPRLPHFIREVYGYDIPNATGPAVGNAGLAAGSAGLVAGAGVAMPAAQDAAAAAAAAFTAPPPAVPETSTAGPVPAAAAELAVAEVPAAQRIDLTQQPKGVLQQEQGGFVYLFSPADLLSTAPLRLVEVAKDQ
jgi:hypothetical protein